MIESILVLIAFMVICGSCLYAQKKHYDFIKSQKHQKDLAQLSDEVMSKIHQCDETKKRVDTLVIRAGFKL